MRSWGARIGRLLLCSWLFVGCTPAGGGGGGDCREADEACSEGFRCVAVSGGAAYACRATCSGDGDCLRAERCEGGLCVDRPPRGLDAAIEDDVAVLEPPPPDLGPEAPDGPIVRIVDEGVEPPVPDRGVVVLPPLDAGVDPEACAGRFDARGTWLMGLALGFAPGSPVFFRVEISDAGGGELAMLFTALRARDRSPIEVEQTEVVGVRVDGDGGFRTGPLVLASPAEANRLGGDLLIELDLEGALRPAGALCGGGEGETVRPAGRSLDGTVFAMAAWQDPIGGVDPFAGCDGCLP